MEEHDFESTNPIFYKCWSGAEFRNHMNRIGSGFLAMMDFEYRCGNCDKIFQTEEQIKTHLDKCDSPISEYEGFDRI